MTRPLAVFLIGILGISCAAIFVRLALPAPPVVTGFWRLALASGVLAAALAVRGRRLAVPRGVRAPLLLAGVCFGADMALWNTAIVETSVANATFLVNTTPVWVGLHALVVLREPPGLRFAAGAACALGGAAFLLGDDLGRGGGLRGDALALAAAGFYSAYLLLMKRVRRDLDAVRAVAGAGAAGALTLAALATLRGEPLLDHPPHSFAAFAAIALVSHVGGVLGIVWALRHLRVAFAAVGLLAQPVGTALLGWLLLGEALSPLQLLGGAGVGLGIWLASRAGGAGETARPTRTSAPPTTGRTPEDPERRSW